ncbi:MAG TPA: phosphotransferase family protein [Solirubrobacteraceae bacterium]|nr:phosphotransferase family protein [Solirubrobacteraceae bacterium]
MEGNQAIGDAPTGDAPTGDAPTRSAPDRTAAIRARLGEVLSELLGASLPGAVRRLSGGASRETYLCDCGECGELILQCEHAGKPTGEPPGQAALLEAAARAGVPVARVLAHGADDHILGAAWTLMETLPGSADPKQIVPAPDADSRPELLDSVAQALAAVHRMPTDTALAPLVEEPLAQLRALHEHLGEPHPVFELAFRTLGDDWPPARRALVHGDFRMGNLMVDGERVSGVLDWELTHIGDPAEDLGWLCVPAWRFARPDLPAAGIGTREQLLAAYERHAGVAVSIEELRRWEIFGTLRWGVICVMQAHTHLSGLRSSIEHAVIGRRACEVEWDLLELLDPGGDAAALLTAEPDAEPDAAPVPLPSLHDRPTAVELLEAARGALGEQVLPGLEGRPAFELRVTLRALGIVRRELEHAERHTELRAQTLAALGVADERELAAAIRAGAFADRAAELVRALRRLVRAKLEVANPGYLQTYANTSERKGT